MLDSIGPRFADWPVEGVQSPGPSVNPIHIVRGERREV